MLKTIASPDPSDESKSREQLIQELIGLRAELATERRRCLRLFEEGRRLTAGEPQTIQAKDKSVKPCLTGPSFMFISERETGIFIEVNQAFSGLTGHSPEEMIGRSFLEMGVISAENRAEIFRRVQENGRVQNMEVEILSKAGEAKICLFSAEPLIGRNRDSLIWSGLDITERKRSEEALRLSEARFRIAAEAAKIGIYSRNFETGQDYWSPEFLAIFGLNPGDRLPLKDGIPAAVHPEDREAVLKEARARFQHSSKPDFSSEHRIILPDGEIRWVMIRGQIEFDDEGRPLRSNGFGLDLTERKRTELALFQEQTRAEAERNRLQAVLDVLPLPVFIADRSGELVEINPVAEKLWGHAPRSERPQDYGEHYRAWWPGTGRRVQAHEWGMARALSKGERCTAEEMEIETPDGRRKIILNYAMPIRDKAGCITGGVAVNVDITARKRAEEALRKSEQHLRDILDNMVAMIGVLTPNGILIEANRTALEAADLRPEEVLGKPFEECYWWAWSPKVQKRLREAIEQAAAGTGCRYDEVIRVGEGRHRIIDFMLVPMFDADGRISYLIPSATDITERREAEEALRRSESFHRQILESIPGMVFTTRPDGFCDYQSLQWVEYTGVSMSEHLGDGWNRLLHPEDRPRAMAAWRKAVAGLAPYDLEYRVRRHDGIYQWFKVIGHPIRDEYGRIARWFGVTMNIEALKRTEHELQKSEKRYRELAETLETERAKLSAVIENLPVGVGTGDPTGRTHSLNRAGLKLHGFQSEAEMFSRLEQYEREFELAYLDGRIMPVEEWPISRALRGEFVQGFELRFRHSMSGSERIMAYSAAPVRNSRGEVVLIVYVMQDLTEQKKTEEALRELNSTLEQKVTERTELAEARTRQLHSLSVALVEAEERERRKISEILHDDLQQLLVSARMQLQGGMKRFDEPMLKNVEHLLTESIEKSRRLSHELSPAILQHAGLAGALEWLARQMEEKFGLEIELKADGRKRFERTPLKTFLFRAVQELLFNVHKHSGSKRARVVVSGTEEGIRIEVADHGKGFNLEMLNSPTAKNGLGLLSLQERTRFFGGNLKIESVPSQGSRLILTAPLGPAHPDERNVLGRRPAEVPAAPAGSSDADGTRSIRVLFADDHQVMRQGLIRLVADQPDIQVVGEAADGQEALTLARQIRPDVIVMDVTMPKMDGVEAARRIKAELPEIRVIGLSMFEDAEIGLKMRAAGAEAFVSKTASSGELLKAIYGMGGREPARYPPGS